MLLAPLHSMLTQTTTTMSAHAGEWKKIKITDAVGTEWNLSGFFSLLFRCRRRFGATNDKTLIILGDRVRFGDRDWFPNFFPIDFSDFAIICYLYHSTASMEALDAAKFTLFYFTSYCQKVLEICIGRRYKKSCSTRYNLFTSIQSD